MIYSFAPIENCQARILILGTMPGKASLLAQQYYAHPQNAFWKLMAEILGFDAGLNYSQRQAALSNAGIALWDVLHSCQRITSLDADIDLASIVVNNFAAFYARHPHIRCVFFNGAHAQALYRKHVAGILPDTGREYHCLPSHRLPSTSPAHARLSFEQKLLAWRQIADEL